MLCILRAEGGTLGKAHRSRVHVWSENHLAAEQAGGLAIVLQPREIVMKTSSVAFLILSATPTQGSAAEGDAK